MIIMATLLGVMFLGTSYLAIQVGAHPAGFQGTGESVLSQVGRTVFKEYPIEILLCDKCLTAHQRFQVPKQYLFPKHYHYRARMTPSVLTGMFGLVHSCEEKFGSLQDKLVLDIG